jgi:hypothetical protein
MKSHSWLILKVVLMNISRTAVTVDAIVSPSEKVARIP